MFVNDTGHLPESGRVCVVGFQPDQTAARTWYSVLINAARAEIEPMAEPKNPAYVLGVGSEVQSLKGPVFAAYFAASRERFDTQPNYKAVCSCWSTARSIRCGRRSISTSIKRGFTTREFTLLRGDRPQRSVEYRWPWYREPFLSADPGLARSQDFLREMSTMVKVYG